MMYASGGHWHGKGLKREDWAAENGARRAQTSGSLAVNRHDPVPLHMQSVTLTEIQAKRV